MTLPGRLAAGDTEEAARLARSALAEQTRMGPDSIRLQSVVWIEHGAACPNSAAPTSPAAPGYRVLLQSAGKIYVVLVHGERAVVCRGGFAVASAVQEESGMQDKVEPEPSDAPSRALVDKARADLAQRLKVAPEEIRLTKFKSVVWPDGSLGCPRPGMMYPQVQQDGLLIRFVAGGQTYSYHGGGGRDPFLCEEPAVTLPDTSEK